MEKTSMENKRVFAGGLIAGAVLTLAVGGCAFVGVTLYQGTKNGSSLEEVGNKTTMEKVNVLEGMIDDYYLEDVSAEDLEQGVYKGLLDALGDPYSVYYTADELETLQEKTQGIYYGIGARVSLDTETQLPKIASVISGTPAEEAGLMANDLLYKADDTELQGMDLSSAVALIRGEEGTSVHLTVIRSGESNYLEFDVVRRKLANETVTSKMLDDNMAYIQIQEFDDVTLDQFTEALDNARSEGMEGLIIDLRGNPGGNLSTVCDICRELLPKGLIHPCSLIRLPPSTRSSTISSGACRRWSALSALGCCSASARAFCKSANSPSRSKPPSGACSTRRKPRTAR